MDFARFYDVKGPDGPDRNATGTGSRHRWSGRPTAWAGVLGLTAAAAVIWTAHSPVEAVRVPATRSSSPAGPSFAASLPWPREGQASAEVEGVGNLGTRGAQVPVPIASVTKVMTAYVVLRDHPLEAGQPGPRIAVDADAASESGSADESTAPLSQGQRFSERQLLELTLMPSANNAARLLARWDSGTEHAFTVRMNRTAAALEMRHTTYTGASGIQATTTSTAADQLLLARAAMRVPVLRGIVGETSTTVPNGPGPVHNTNRLLGFSGVVGLKTGSSSPAGGALMWAAEAKVGTVRRLVLGVVLRQGAGGSPQQGLEAALDNSLKLIEGIEKALGAIPATQAAGGSR